MKDSSYKGLSEKFDAAYDRAQDAMKVWENNDKPDRSKDLHEKVEQTQAEMKEIREKITSKKSLLEVDYNRKLEAEKGMEAGNPLGMNAQTMNARKSLLDLIMENPEVKSLPNFTDNEGNILGKSLKNFDWKNGLTINFGSKDLNPVAATRDPRIAPGVAMKAGEITTGVATPLPQLVTPIVPYPLVATRIMDLVPTEQMTSNTLQFRRQTTLTRNEATGAENTAVTNTTYNVATTTITAYMIKGKQVFSEEEILSIPNIIEFGSLEATRDMRRTGANQILQGNNTGTNWNGVNGQADTSTQFILGTTAPVTDNNGDPITIIDAVGYSIKILKTTGACVPDMAVGNPNQVTAIRHIKDKFGRYLYGDPSQAVVDLFLWGIRLIDEIEQPSGQILVGDWGGFYRLSIFQGLQMQLGFDSDNFGKYMRTLRYSLYGANRVFRTTAFSVVSNLPS